MIGEIDVLPALYGSVNVPATVHRELTAPETPWIVKRWADALPPWVRLNEDAATSALPPPTLGMGERQAIALAQKGSGAILLADDRQARVAAQRGINTFPTIRILSVAGALSLLDFDSALTRLLKTNFRISSEVIQQVRKKTR